MGDVTDTERAIAHHLVAECAGCASLLADIGAISAAARHDLPVPRRTRDFRLSTDDAARLSGRRGFLAWLRGALLPGGWAVQPLAGAALSIGLVLVVAGTVLPPPTQTTLESRTVTPAAGSSPAAGAPSDLSGRQGATDAAGAESSVTGGRSNAQPLETAYPADSAPAASARAATAAPDRTSAASLAPVAAGSTSGSEASPPAAYTGPEPTPGVEESGNVLAVPSPAATGTTPEPGENDQATSTPPAFAAAGPGATPTPTAGDEASALRSEDDRRPLLILAGFLLLLSGAVLLMMRRVARRA